MIPRQWGTLREEVKAEMDIEDEGFISDLELMAAANHGIRVIEGAIMGTWEGYLKTTYEIPLITDPLSSLDPRRYACPADLFAQRVEYMYFDDGNDCKSQIEMGQPWQLLKAQTAADKGVTPDNYYYDIEHGNPVLGREFVFYGLPTFTDSHLIKLWYIRHITRVSTDASYINIPEFENIVALYVKKRIAEKEKNPLLSSFLQELRAETQLMINAIINQAPDGLEITPDVSFYNDMR